MCCFMNQIFFVQIAFVLSIIFTSVEPFLTQQNLAGRCLQQFQSTNATHSIFALILARGGSKGIPLKNLATVNGISLLGRALRVIYNCRNCFEEVWVSTDNEMIAQEAKRYNAYVHYRSEYSARDEATSIESVQEFLNEHSYIHNVALIQCTSVFIYEQYLEAAVKLFNGGRRGVDCVFSVQRSFKLRWQEVPHSNWIKAVNFDPKKRPRRQDWHGELIETGMFYFTRRHLIETDGILQNERCKFVEIDGQHVLEIDHPHQLSIANVLVND